MFRKLTNDARLPERATKYSAGVDVFANENVVIGAGETRLIGLGIALDEELVHEALYRSVSMSRELWMSLHYFALHIRSSLRAKGLTSLGTGVIDMDYRDEIKMVIHNPIARLVNFQDGYTEALGTSDILAQTSIGYQIKKGDKIGQLIICRHEGWLLP